MRVIALFILAGFAASCKRDYVADKIVGDFPVNNDTAVVPARATQNFFLLKRDLLNTLVPVISRLVLTTRSFPELTGPDNLSRYTFQRGESHYGSATFTIQFLDATNAVIDPISVQSSTTTLSKVNVSVIGTSNQYSYSESLVLTLAIAGDVGSEKRLTGTSVLTDQSGGGYNVSFTLPSPGAMGIFGGLTDGIASGTGTDVAGRPISISLTFNSHLEANGPLTWDGKEGSIHFAESGTGFVVTTQARILVD
ncbi:MAG: hypothetical protein LHV69_06600 [Elusimicrobia bacterium]|nr:hypothetical protein [Candidatus Obscuribacterium magneticum]